MEAIGAAANEKRQTKQKHILFSFDFQFT